MYIDTHSHLYAQEFDADREEAIQRAQEAGVVLTILPDIDKNSRAAELELATRHPEQMLPLLGVHPTSINTDYKEELKALEKALGQQSRVYGIGECGIDLYWDKSYFREQQRAFEYQLNLARELDIPIIIHSRESLPEIFQILKEQKYNMKGIFHCFPGNEEEARRAIDLGFLLGIGGVVTFKNSRLGEHIRAIGPEHLVLETDAPYLAPAPHRGKRNESSYIPLIAAKVAEIFSLDVKIIEQTTTNNALNLFNLQWPIQ